MLSPFSFSSLPLTGYRRTLVDPYARPPTDPYRPRTSSAPPAVIPLQRFGSRGSVDSQLVASTPPRLTLSLDSVDWPFSATSSGSGGSASESGSDSGEGSTASDAEEVLEDPVPELEHELADAGSDDGHGLAHGPGPDDSHGYARTHGRLAGEDAPDTDTDVNPDADADTDDGHAFEPTYMPTPRFGLRSLPMLYLPALGPSLSRVSVASDENDHGHEHGHGHGLDTISIDCSTVSPPPSPSPRAPLLGLPGSPARTARQPSKSIMKVRPTVNPVHAPIRRPSLWSVSLMPRRPAPAGYAEIPAPRRMVTFAPCATYLTITEHHAPSWVRSCVRTTRPVREGVCTLGMPRPPPEDVQQQQKKTKQQKKKESKQGVSVAMVMSLARVPTAGLKAVAVAGSHDQYDETRGQNNWHGYADGDSLFDDDYDDFDNYDPRYEYAIAAAPLVAQSRSNNRVHEDNDSSTIRRARTWINRRVRRHTA